MRWSRRLPADLSASELQRALAALPPGIDLTLSNPTAAGLRYDADAVRRALSAPEVLRYAPEPLGDPEARAAVGRYAGVDAERVVLTASTSEAYALVLKLLCDPGDAVAVPVPSYPLVPHLCELEGVEAVRYELSFERGRWRMDLASLERALSVGVRAVVVVSPNNPTGQVPEEIAEVRRLCGRAGAALVSDEVFAPYGPNGRLPSLGSDELPLCFVLDGLSKAAGLPQLKLGWMVVHGSDRAAALSRLEWIADAYLSVGTPVQRAAPALLGLAAGMQAQIRARLAENRACLERAFAGSAVEVLPADGGWYAVLKLQGEVDEAALVVRLLREARVLVQPGFLYDFPVPGYLVVSLLPERFVEGAGALSQALRM